MNINFPIIMKKSVTILLLLFAFTLCANTQNAGQYVRRQPSQQNTQKSTQKSAQKTTQQNTQKSAHKSTPQKSKSGGGSICPDGNHPHMIDLGLPSGTKWACCNIGANNPEDYGGYYAWGMTEKKERMTDLVYPYSTGEDTDGNGWYDKDIKYQNLGSNIAGTQYDVAHVIWGEPWQMPTKEQIQELLDNCIYIWTTYNGIKGGRFTSKKNRKSIFLPTGSYTLDGILNYQGNYWSSTLEPSRDDSAVQLRFLSGYVTCDWTIRHYQHPVRPVCK